MGATVRRQALRTRGCETPFSVPCAVRTSDLGEVAGGDVGLLLDEAHHVATDGHGFSGIVWDAQADEHVGKAHDSQTNLAGLEVHGSDFGYSVFVYVDGVVQEVNSEFYGPAEAVPVDAR